jgi:hypothetical protein
MNKKDFIYHKDEINTKGVLGITHNKIVEIPNFVTPEIAESMIHYFESKSINWGDIAFYGSSGMGVSTHDNSLSEYNLPLDFFDTIRNNFKEAVELVFERKVKPNTSHAQKWDVGGFAAPHSDNSDYDGNPNSFEINKYVGILYLNNDYEGGELYFVNEGKNFKNQWETYLSFKPNAYSFITFPGGVENIHGVSEITKGTRYTMVSFWDFEESVYSQEILDKWKEEEKLVRMAQAKQKEEWQKGNKYA